MKKIILSICTMFILNSLVLASPPPHKHEKKEHLPPPPPPVEVINEVNTSEETPFKDCNRHYLYTHRTTYYYSDGTNRSSYAYSVIDQYGNEIIPSCWSIKHLTNNNEHFFIVNDKNLVSENDTTMSTNNKFQKITNLSHNRLLVKKNKHYGIITYDKQEILPIMHKSIKEINTGIFIVKLNDAFGVYTINGKCILPTNNKKISKLGDSYYKVEKDGKYGVMDIYGNVLAEPKYKKVKLDHNILKISQDGITYKNIQPRY